MTSTSHLLFQQPWPEGEHRHFQIGFVVNDVVGAAASWAHVFGVGPFHVLPPIEQACTYRGAATGVNVQVAVAQAGPVQVELMQQHCDRPSVYRELAETGHARFHQLGIVTSDYERTTARYAQLGYEVMCEMVSHGQHIAFVDTLGDFGFFTEITEDVPGFLDSLHAISRTCAEWDGTDPVRILTRDGYRTP